MPFNEHFQWGNVQYAPVAIFIVVGGAMLWWTLSARKWFTGPVRTIDGVEPDAHAVTSPCSGRRLGEVQHGADGEREGGRPPREGA